MKDDNLYVILTKYYSKKGFKDLEDDFKIETDILVLRSAIQGVLNSSQILCDRKRSVRLKERELEKSNS